MDEVMMVPVEDFKRLENYYKGQITESTLLNKAGRLAAEQHIILKDKSIPDSIAVRMTKPMALDQDRLVKRIRTGKRGPPVYQGTEEPEGMADGPSENLMKQIIKGLSQSQSEATTTETPMVKKIKKEYKSKIPTPIKKTVPQPKPSKPSDKPKSVFKSIVKGAKEELFHSLTKGKGPKKKKKKSEAEKLKPSKGWESWYPQGDLRKKLDYGTDSD